MGHHFPGQVWALELSGRFCVNVPSSGLHSASVMEAGPVVYNHAHQERRRTRRDRTRAYTELVEKSRTKRVSFQLADIYNLFIFHLKN